MVIFNIQVFGSDKEAFLNLDVLEKVDYIKKHSNQQNDDLINEYLSNLSMYAEDKDRECLTCNLLKNDSNISKRDVKQNVDSEQSSVVIKPSGTNNTKRRGYTKKAKD